MTANQHHLRATKKIDRNRKRIFMDTFVMKKTFPNLAVRTAATWKLFIEQGECFEKRH